MAGRATAIFVQRERKSGAAEPAELIGLPACGGHVPARFGGAGQPRGAMAQQKTESAAFARGQCQAARGGEIGERCIVRQFDDGAGERAAFERFFHGPERIDRARGFHHHEIARGKALSLIHISEPTRPY